MIREEISARRLRAQEKGIVNLLRETLTTEYGHEGRKPLTSAISIYPCITSVIPPDMGSIASLCPSPRRLNAITVIMMAKHGMNTSAPLSQGRLFAILIA